MMSNTCEASSSGFMLQRQSAAAATIGAAKLVPSNWSKSSGGWSNVGTATQMRSPGADRSTCGEPVVKKDGMPFESTAPTVRTWGRLAGYSGGFPFWRLFPAAATMRMPAACVTATIRSISGFLISEPRLRFTTPGRGGSRRRDRG